MKVISNEGNQLSPEYTAAITSRPDGNILLTLRRGKKIALRKVLDEERLRSEKCINTLIRELVRDIKLASGDVSWREKKGLWAKGILPTFTGKSVQVTASKTLFLRRKINNTVDQRT